MTDLANVTDRAAAGGRRNAGLAALLALVLGAAMVAMSAMPVPALADFPAAANGSPPIQAAPSGPSLRADPLVMAARRVSRPSGSLVAARAAPAAAHRVPAALPVAAAAPRRLHDPRGPPARP